MTFNDQRFFTVNPHFIEPNLSSNNCALFTHILCPSYSKKKKAFICVKKAYY